MPPALRSLRPSRTLLGVVCLASAFSLNAHRASAAVPDPLPTPLVQVQPLTPGETTRAAASPDSPPQIELPDAPDAGSDASSSSSVYTEPRRATLAELALAAEPKALAYRESPSSARVIGLVSQAGQPMTSRERDVACQAGTLKGRLCRYSWAPILWQMFEATAIENVGNITLDTETRNDLLTRPYWSTYLTCVHQYRYRQWSDDTPFIVHDIGHPMQGAIVYSIVAQNDPHTRGLTIANNGNYWRGKLKAMAVVTLYEIQWKIGPASEAAIGNSGLNTYFTPSVHGRSTNETGFQDFVITPVYGLGWNMAEDLADRYIMPKVWRHTHNKWALTAYSVLTPCKALANILRYKPFYYRDFDLPPVGSAAVRQ